jgi:rare lipoprotein A
MSAIKLTVRWSAIVRCALLAACGGAGLSACASVTPMPEGLASPMAQYSDRSADTGAHRAMAQGASQTPAQGGARYKVGAPYQAGGVWYVPAEQPNYDEVGLASWYGDQFNGKPTANGEMFDMNGISAAHATLPMPCIVEVTNLENGKTLQVRMNDRGPFHPGRIIDLSRAAAQQLGYFNKGTTQVRVRYVGPAQLNGMDAPTTIAANHMHALLPLMPIAPAAALPTPAATSPGVVTTARSGFAVQAGAFSDRGNAERVAARLATAGRTNIQTLDRAGSTLYRVTVGSWASAEEAGTAREQVVSLGFAQAQVISGS